MPLGQTWEGAGSRTNRKPEDQPQPVISFFSPRREEYCHVPELSKRDYRRSSGRVGSPAWAGAGRVLLIHEKGFEMLPTKRFFLFLVANVFLVTGCPNGGDDPCEDVVCGDHGACNPDSGACDCDAGYHVQDGACEEDDCAVDADCSDGAACNGEESCEEGVCVDGIAVICGDNAHCEEPDGGCVCDAGFIPEGDECVEEILPLEIAGSYVDDWGIQHEVTDATWTMDESVFHVSSYSNDEEFLVAQNDADNQWNPDMWSRFDWTWDGQDLYFCQIVYDAITEQEAAGNTGADRADLAAGCSGFGWSRLIPN